MEYNTSRPLEAVMHISSIIKLLQGIIIEDIMYIITINVSTIF